MQLPFIHLNLCFNPFGELTAQQRINLAVVDLEGLQSVLYEQAIAIQFYADHGRGKTTHLLSLHQLYPKVEYIKLHSGERPEIQPRSIRFVDSIENLPGRKRLNLYRKTASIALTTHTDLTKELNRAGYRVINRHVSTVDNETLLKIFNSRIEYARRGAGAIPVVDMCAIGSLKSLFGDDIRAMEACLYDRVQNMKGVDNVKV